MDPKACLERAKILLQNGEIGDAKDSLDDYISWRVSGGFEPTNGDKIFSLLRDAANALDRNHT